MRYDATFALAIPVAAMEWAKEQAKYIVQDNSRLSLDQIAAICVLRGLIIGATAPELCNARAIAAPERKP